MSYTAVRSDPHRPLAVRTDQIPGRTDKLQRKAIPFANGLHNFNKLCMDVTSFDQKSCLKTKKRRFESLKGWYFDWNDPFEVMFAAFLICHFHSCGVYLTWGLPKRSSEMSLFSDILLLKSILILYGHNTNKLRRNGVNPTSVGSFWPEWQSSKF